MERPQFEQIVTEMEALNRRDPEGYRRKVGRFASLGFAVYAAVFLVLLLLLALAVWLLAAGNMRGSTVRLVIFVGVLVFIFGRALWIKIDPPEGRLLRPDEAPALTRELERIRQQIGAPPIYQVLLNDDYNAFASSSPKFGVFGERCYVVLGMPLLMTQRPEEVIATIGHELAHHSKSHVRSGMRAYRLEAMWHNVLVQLSATGSLVVWPMLWFVKWYSPRFSAMSLVLRRQAEFEADAVGAEASSKQAMAIGLIRMGVDGATRLKPYFESLKMTAHDSAVPPAAYLRGLVQQPTADREKVRAALVRTLRSETVYEDSHPSTRERTIALGIPADPDDPKSVDRLMEMLGTVEVSAAQAFFGDRLETVAEEFEKKWQESVKELWAESHEEYKESVAALAKYASRRPEDLTEKEAAEWVRMLGNVNGIANASKEAVLMSNRFPENGELQYLAGYSLLENDDESGVAFLERSAELDRRIQGAALEAIAGFRAGRGESRAARESAFAAAEAHETATERYERLLDIKRGDDLYPSGADQQEVDRIVAVLPEMKRIKYAYSFRRKDAQTPGMYLDVVVLDAVRPTFVSSDDDFVSKETTRAYELMGDTKGVFVMVVVHGTAISKVLDQHPQLRVYTAT